MKRSATDTGKMSIGTYASRFLGIPVRTTKTDPWRAHSTALASQSMSSRCPSSVRAAILAGEQLAVAVDDAELEILPLDENVLDREQFLEGADVDHGAHGAKPTTKVGLEV